MAMDSMAPEMSRNLRQLVDNSFEEAQFESAVSTLDTLRSPHHTPSPIHMLYLIFISLHPFTHPTNLEDPTSQPISASALLLQSPRKIIKITKAAALSLSPAAVLASHRLLHAFLRTNGPDIFTRALPSYAQYKLGVDGELEFVDSPIHHQALAIRNARAVWDVIKDGFLLRVARALPPPGKAPKGKIPLVRDPSFTAQTSSEYDLKPVADDSWHVLECLVDLFEADAERSGSPKHSLLLLSQLPLPPIGTHTRWDASEPLKVVFHALAQHDNPRRVRLGLRLLLLLIDLSHTTYLNLPSFVTNVLVQMSAAAPLFSSLPSPCPSTSPSPSTSTSTPPPPPTHHQKALTHLLSLLPSLTPAQCAFKMALCRKILLGLDDPDSASASAAQGGGGRDAAQDAHAMPPPSPVKVNLATTSAGVGVGVGVNTSTASAGGAGAGAGKNLNARPRPKPIPKRRKIAVEGEGDAAVLVPASTSTSIPSTSLPSTSLPSTSLPPALPTPPAPTLPPPPAQQQRPKATLQHVPLATLEEMARLLSLVPPPSPCPSTLRAGTRTQRQSGSGKTLVKQKRKAPMRTKAKPTRGGKANGTVNGTASTSTSNSTSTSSGAEHAQNKDTNSEHDTEHEQDHEQDPNHDPNPEQKHDHEHEQDHDQEHEPENPYTTPFSLLLRVRFEFVRAWLFVRFRFRFGGVDGGGGGGVGDSNSNTKDKDKERAERDELEKLIDTFFGCSRSGVDGIAKKEEKEDEVQRDEVKRDEVQRDKSLYRELLLIALAGCV